MAQSDLERVVMQWSNLGPKMAEASPLSAN